MKTAREIAHAIICERQESEWCHWTTDRTVHAHYCDTLTAAIESDSATLLGAVREAVKAFGDVVDTLFEASTTGDELIGRWWEANQAEVRRRSESATDALARLRTLLPEGTPAP